MAMMNLKALIIGFVISGILFNICLVIELIKEKINKKREL